MLDGHGYICIVIAPAGTNKHEHKYNYSYKSDMHAGASTLNVQHQV